jgi:hypothetical protein
MIRRAAVPAAGLAASRRQLRGAETAPFRPARRRRDGKGWVNKNV